ncbi:hypothetical protein AUK22_08685 [bacterium CG2_30_54_10]|nr:MAG: hypothetical protein AUK22_08685 [bacterium CG2_30_54_10]
MSASKIQRGWHFVGHSGDKTGGTAIGSRNLTTGLVDDLTTNLTAKLSTNGTKKADAVGVEIRATDGLSALTFRAVVFTGVAGAVCFLTTGFASHFAVGTIGCGLLLALWGAPFRLLQRLAPLGTLGFFGWAVFLWGKGTPGIVALTQFACGIMGMQWLAMEDESSAKRGLVISGMIVLAVAAMSVNFLFPLALAPFVVTLLFSLALLADNPPEAPSLGGNFRRYHGRTPAFGSLSFWGAVVRGAFIFLIFWVGLFYLMPRPDVLGIASGAAKRRLTGFSETLQLGESGILENNPMVVMRVQPVISETRHKKMLQLLQNTALRGCSFVSYHNGSWSRAGYRSMAFNLRRAGGEIEIQEFKNDTRPELELEFLLESIDPPIFFLPTQAMRLRSSTQYISIDSDGTLGVPARYGGVEIYQCRTKLGPPHINDVDLASAAFPAFTRPFLDPGNSGGSIQDLALEVTKDSKTLFQAVSAISNFLRRNFSYTLEQQSQNVRDPVSTFLVTRGSGNCELFASALVLMLRNLNIPARPVNGYLLTEWNDYGGFFTVRQRDAHTWAEVFFPDRGWVPFDPTPPGGSEQASAQNQWFGRVELWERFEGFWFNYVYRFDSNIQMAGFAKLYQVISRPFAPRGFHVVGFLLVILAVGVGLKMRRDRRREAVAELGGWLPDWYRDWARKLPIPRKSWETPREFHRRLISAGLWASESESGFAELEHEVYNAAFAGNLSGSAERARPILNSLQAARRASDNVYKK